LEQFDELYDPYSGIANILSESYNAVLKQENEWKELPVDMLVLGFHFLQTFEHFEIMRGMAGIGDYHLKAEFSRASIPPEELAFSKYVLDNNLITLVPTQGAFIVQDRSGKYCVTLFPKESYQCPSTTTCFHILAANMSIGQEPIEKRSVVNLRLLKKNTRKRVVKKSDKKQPRPNDYEPIVEPAPDSAFVTNTPKTPSSILSTKNTDKKDVHKTSRKTPISKKKLHFNIDTIQEDRSSCSDDVPDLPDLHCPFTPGNKRPAEDVSTHTPESLPPKRIKLEFSAPKIQEHILSDTSPWVGSLTQKDKNIIAGKQWLTSKIIEEVHDILSKQLTLISGFQKPCNAPAYNTTLKKWVSNYSFTEQQGPAVQIHHTGNHHWVTSILTHTNELFLLDSMYDKLTTSLEIQLLQVYSNSIKGSWLRFQRFKNRPIKLIVGCMPLLML
jgi:hypothetical protein